MVKSGIRVLNTRMNVMIVTLLNQGLKEHEIRVSLHMTRQASILRQNPSLIGHKL